MGLGLLKFYLDILVCSWGRDIKGQEVRFSIG